MDRKSKFQSIGCNMIPLVPAFPRTGVDGKRWAPEGGKNRSAPGALVASIFSRPAGR